MNSRRRLRCISWATPSLLAVLLGAPAIQAEGGKPPENDHDKVLYSLGVNVGRNLKSQFHLEPGELDMVSRGMTDTLLGRESEIDADLYGAQLQALARERSAAATELEKVASAKFLEEAATTEGAVRTESGLIITEIETGGGDAPAASDTVKVHYHGTLRDGTVFDSSVQRGKPAEFPLDRVIPCWTEGLQLLKVGGKSKLVCPAEIAYGDRGSPPVIPGGAVLTFEVELLEIVAK